MIRCPRLAAVLLALLPLALGGPGRAAAPAFVTFESGPVRPLALSPDGSLLFACNLPDARLEIFAVTEDGLEPVASVPVGLEPVAVAARSDTEVWVVNHLSDSVSVVDVPSRRVVRTLLVGDEPRDLVFAGPGRSRAFVTTARRGQHRTHPSLTNPPAVPGAGDPLLTTPGVPRADVWVFDAANPGPGPGGTPLRIVELFGDTPRGLAVSPDGSLVYAGIFHSGNRSTAISEGGVCDGFAPDTPCTISGTQVPGGVGPPAVNVEGRPAPEVGVIVQQDAGGAWRDDLGRDWSPAVRFDLPDQDVFEIDAETLEEVRSWSGVGTILFNLAVHPTSGKVYVSNLESRNLTRFEGPGTLGTTVQGHLAEARIAILSPAETLSRHLNRHLDYSKLASAPGFDPGAKAHSLSTPLEIAFSSDGGTVYVAALGSDRVGVFPAAALEDDSFDPTALSAGYLRVPHGPAGLALDEARGRLYVATRFDNAVAVLDLATRRERQRHRLHNPEPPSVVAGPALPVRRPVQLGQRRGVVRVLPHLRGLRLAGLGPRQPGRPGHHQPDPHRDRRSPASDADQRHRRPRTFHPLKGPMTTQTLRGLATLRRDALARRPRDRRAGHRRLRRGALVQQLHRGLRGAARPQATCRARPRCRPSRTSRCRSRSRPTPCARSTTSSRLGRAGGPRLLQRPDLPTPSSTATAATPWTRPTASSAPTAGRASRTSPRSSRSPTCATRIRRSGCSG
jgi:YVTN family beta-propeller protein